MPRWKKLERPSSHPVNRSNKSGQMGAGYGLLLAAAKDSNAGYYRTGRYLYEPGDDYLLVLERQVETVAEIEGILDSGCRRSNQEDEARGKSE